MYIHFSPLLSLDLPSLPLRYVTKGYIHCIIKEYRTSLLFLALSRQLFILVCEHDRLLS